MARLRRPPTASPTALSRIRKRSTVVLGGLGCGSPGARLGRVGLRRSGTSRTCTRMSCRGCTSVKCMMLEPGPCCLVKRSLPREPRSLGSCLLLLFQLPAMWPWTIRGSWMACGPS
eukprot:10609891-Alexandrium_andersonii.AAC.1